MSRCSRYSRMEHIAESVLFSRYTDDALMAMFIKYSGYFDASGHPDQHEVLTVAGFVSSVKKWMRMEQEWNRILKEYGVKYFHTTEYVSSAGCFTDWKNQSAKRKEFQDKLWACIIRNTNKACRASVIIKDYEEINAVFALEERLGRPYAICAASCLYSSRQWAKRKHSERATLYYFEDGDKDKGDFQRVAKQDGLPVPLFLPKDECVAFQVADYAAWKMRSSIAGALKPDHTIEKGLRLLESVKDLRQIPWSAGVMNKEAMFKYCQFANVPRR
jgi:hypothetical protein